MGVSALLGNAWRAYRANWDVCARLMTVYYLLPLLVLLGVGFALMVGTGLLADVQAFSVYDDIFSSLAKESPALVPEEYRALAMDILVKAGILFLVAVPLLIAFFFISFFAYVGEPEKTPPFKVEWFPEHPKHERLQSNPNF